MLLAELLIVVAALYGATREVDVNCGTNSLYVSLRALDLPPATFSELQKTLGHPSKLGHSIAQLDVAARHYGAHTLAVQTSVENLRIRPRPFACIAHVNGSHFVTIGEITEQNALIIDPPRSYAVPVDALRAMWDGKALLVASTPLVSEADLSDQIASAKRWRRIWIAVCVFAGGLTPLVVFGAWRKRKTPE